MDNFIADAGDSLDDEDTNDSNPELGTSITTRLSAKGDSIDEGNMMANRDTEFIAFLGLIEKLMNDIRTMDEKFLEDRDINEVLLEQNCRIKL